MATKTNKIGKSKVDISTQIDSQETKKTDVAPEKMSLIEESAYRSSVKAKIFEEAKVSYKDYEVVKWGVTVRIYTPTLKERLHVSSLGLDIGQTPSPEQYEAFLVWFALNKILDARTEKPVFDKTDLEALLQGSVDGALFPLSNDYLNMLFNIERMGVVLRKN